MTKRHKHIIKVDSSVAPVVELDSLAHAAYIRFSKHKVRRTVVVDVKGCLATMDLAENGSVIGVELVGVDEFRIETLIKKAGICGVSEEQIRNTRYVPATAQPVLA